MKQPNALLKVAVVLSSVLLVSGFVAYRVGAFDRLFRSGAPSVDSGNGPNLGENPSDGTTPALLPGSKVDVLSNAPRGNSTLFPLPPATTPPERTIIYGPKSAPVFGPVKELPDIVPTIIDPVTKSGPTVPPAPNTPAATPPTPSQPSKPEK